MYLLSVRVFDCGVILLPRSDNANTRPERALGRDLRRRRDKEQPTYRLDEMLQAELDCEGRLAHATVTKDHQLVHRHVFARHLD